MEGRGSSLAAAIFLCFVAQTSSQQRVAPGVPPQHYQGQPQMHQVPVQHVQQPPPIQQHQVPVQVQHQQQFAQQPPIQQQQHQGHQAHHGHHGPPQVLNVANIAQEKEHIAEHLSVPIDTSKMTEQELQFHYFKMHDTDNNNKLDGCELIKSLIHWHGESEGEVKVHKEEDLELMVNTVLQGADMDNDGFITYAEFKSLNV